MHKYVIDPNTNIKNKQHDQFKPFLINKEQTKF